MALKFWRILVQLQRNSALCVCYDYNILCTKYFNYPDSKICFFFTASSDSRFEYELVLNNNLQAEKFSREDNRSASAA